MLIEIVGIPGSGKSTLYKSLTQELKRQNVDFVDAQTILATRSNDDSAPRYVQKKPQRDLLYRFTRFTVKNPEFFEKAQQTFGEASTKKFLFFLACAHFQLARDLNTHNEMVFFDEALLTHCASIYPKTEQQSDLVELLNCAPEIDVLIHLEIPPDVAFDRAVARHGGTEKTRARIVSKFGDKFAFAARANNIKAGIKTFTERGSIVFNVDATKAFDEVVEKLVHDLVATQAKASQI